MSTDRMVRKQIYLTVEQDRLLALRAAQLGCTQSEVIRSAIELALESQVRSARDTILREAFGIWAERDDLPDFDALRRESDDRGPARRTALA